MKQFDMQRQMLLADIMRRFLEEERDSRILKVQLYRANETEENTSAYFTSYMKSELKFGHVKMRIKYKEDNTISLIQMIEENEIVFERKDKELKQYLMEIKLAK